MTVELIKISDYCWEIPRTGDMNVPGRIYTSPALLETIRMEEALSQVANVACLPGIVTASMAMPDIHWGYGFPIGGVAAFDWQTGIISPGGVGYDINCGCRLMTSRLHIEDIQNHLKEINYKFVHLEISEFRYELLRNILVSKLVYLIRRILYKVY